MDEERRFYFRSIFFRDVDRDGDNDIYLASEGDNTKTNGIVLLNNGNFNFDLIRPDEALALYTDGSNKTIIIGRKKHIPTDEEQSVFDIVKPADALMLVEDRTDAKITIKYKKTYSN